jgi:hypothetical protein
LIQKSQELSQGVQLEQKTSDEFEASKVESTPKSVGAKENTAGDRVTPPSSASGLTSRERNPDGELLRMILEKVSAFSPEQIEQLKKIELKREQKLSFVISIF